MVANETSEVSNDWKTLSRASYVGSKRDSVVDDLNREHGETGWRIAYAWGKDVILRERALEIYTDAYTEFLRADRELTDWLVREARDVYDTAPSNVNSGCDYEIQEDGATHLQDIAIRQALLELGRHFEGQRLVQIRGYRSEGYRLNPGVVPFHQPGQIVQPELKGWWKPGSIESFWQSNKLLQVRSKT